MIEVLIAVTSETLQSNGASNQFWKTNNKHKVFTEKVALDVLSMMGFTIARI
jgi:hypothetical protein